MEALTQKTERELLIENFIKMIDRDIEIDVKQGYINYHFEEFFDNYENGLGIEVEGTIYCTHGRDYSWEYGPECETEFEKPDFDKVIFWQDEEEIEFTEEEKNKILTNITFH